MRKLKEQSREANSHGCAGIFTEVSGTAQGPN
jgi:hypothetical protein